MQRIDNAIFAVALALCGAMALTGAIGTPDGVLRRTMSDAEHHCPESDILCARQI